MCDFYKLDVDKFNELIKYTSFSCAPDYDEFPYSSIMIFGEENNFSGQSSDKHRISLYGANLLIKNPICYPRLQVT